MITYNAVNAQSTRSLGWQKKATKSTGHKSSRNLCLYRWRCSRHKNSTQSLSIFCHLHYIICYWFYGGTFAICSFYGAAL